MRKISEHRLEALGLGDDLALQERFKDLQINNPVTSHPIDKHLVKLGMVVIENGMTRIKEPFCYHCDCDDCLYGHNKLSHAKTEKGWICDICYMYEVCIDAQTAAGEPCDPCKDKDCKHRPKLLEEFVREPNLIKLY